MMLRAGTEDSPASARAAGSPRSSAPQVPSSHLLGTIHNQESQQASGLGVEGLSWQQGRGRRKEEGRELMRVGVELSQVGKG